MTDGGADPDTSDDKGMTALMQAAFWKHAEVVRALLAAGVFVETEEGEQVGSLVMRGQAEPKNKLVFNAWGLQGEPTGSFYDAFDKIVTLAENEKNATCQPDDWEVHPALVTQRELEIFNEPIKRSELLVALERRNGGGGRGEHRRGSGKLGDAAWRWLRRASAGTRGRR